MRHTPNIDNPYYKSLTRSMVPTVILVSFAPMILVSLVILYHFQTSYTDKVNAHLKELVLKHKQNIDIFLEEETSDLRLLAKTFDITQLQDEAFLQKELFMLENEHRGGFVDIGLVNAKGRQIAYAGPFKLGDADYSDADWFRQAMAQEVYISDVFLGLRGMPHFIIAVKKRYDQETWILRATIDFESFNNLVEDIRIGETGFALIINRQNRFQTKSPTSPPLGSAIYNQFFDAGSRDNDGVQIFTQKQEDGEEYIYVSSTLKNGEWLLVYRQHTSDAFSIIQKARTLALLIFILGGLGIITMAVLLSNRVVGLIAKADHEKELMNRQVIESGKLASIGELASGVAHEINNPVAIMVEEAGWIQDLLEEENRSHIKNFKEMTRALNQIQTQGKRCKDITHKLLSFARRTESNNQKIDIGELIRETITLTHQRTKYNNICVKTEISHALPCVQASQTELQQVLLNLLNNAFDAMEPKGGEVMISCRFIQDELNIVVSDTGPGIPETNIQRIFDPFFTTKPVGKGTGLGLSICYGIVNKMGGNIDVESNPEQGARFCIHIPV